MLGMTANPAHGGIIPFRSSLLVERDADTGCVVSSQCPIATGLLQAMLGSEVGRSGEKRSDSGHQGWETDHAKKGGGD